MKIILFLNVNAPMTHILLTVKAQVLPMAWKCLYDLPQSCCDFISYHAPCCLLGSSYAGLPTVVRYAPVTPSTRDILHADTHLVKPIHLLQVFAHLLPPREAYSNNHIHRASFPTSLPSILTSPHPAKRFP